MARSLSSLADNLAERIHKIKLNTDMIIKNVKCMKLNTKIVSDILNTETSDLLKNTHFLTIIPISFFTCCEKLFSHMNIWIIDKNSMEISLPKKEDFHNHLNMEDFTNADYTHANTVCKDFETKHLGE